MELSEKIRNLLAETEQTTGFQVAVTEDATLTVMSGVLMAAWDRPGHLIRVHPKAARAHDYYVAYYCRMIQRFFENPPDQRFSFGVGEKGHYHVQKLIHQMPFAKRMSEAAIRPICHQLLTGFMTHLRSIPLGLRLDDWIYCDWPELAEMQRLVIEPQLQENIRATGDDFRKVCPRPVFDATMAINAAFAQFWSEKWSQPELTLPYKASGHLAAGERLLRILSDTPDSGTTDRTLIDSWGAELGVSNWYLWVPYKSPQR